MLNFSVVVLIIMKWFQASEVIHRFFAAALLLKLKKNVHSLDIAFIFKSAGLANQALFQLDVNQHCYVFFTPFPKTHVGGS